jgi:hypothetical protein
MSAAVKFLPCDWSLSDEEAKLAGRITVSQEVAILAALEQIGTSGGFIIGDDPGFGKTGVGAEIIVRGGFERVLLIALGDTHKQWDERIRLQSDGRLGCRIMNGSKAGRAEYEAFMKHEPGIFIATADFLREKDWESVIQRDDMGRPIYDVDKKTGLIKLKPRKEGEIGPAEFPIFKTKSEHKGVYRKFARKPLDAVVFDECFVAGTLVDTPRGPKAIESLVAGDEVYGYNHESGRVVVTTVAGSMRRMSQEVLPCGATANHPFYVDGVGYTPAADLTREDRLLERHGEGVRAVRAGVRAISGKPIAEVLRPEMLEHLESEEPSGSHGDPSGRESKVGIFTRWEALDIGDLEAQLGSSCPRSPISTHVGGEPIEKSRGGRASEGISTRIWGHIRAPFGRKRSGHDGSTGAATLPAGGGVEAGIHCANPVSQGPRGAAYSLQDRPSVARNFASSRVRRGVSQFEDREEQRCEEGHVSHISGVDSLAILQPRDIGRYEAVRRENLQSRPEAVYNIETGTSNYFVDGVLVHNCQAIANRKSATRRTIYSIKARLRGALSGTWFLNALENMWSVSRWVWPGENPETGQPYVETNHDVWKSRYLLSEVVSSAKGRVVKVGRQERVLTRVVGERVQGEFVGTLPCYIRREMPQVPDPAVIRLPATPQQAAQMEELQKDLVTWVLDWQGNEIPLVVDLPPILRMRLRQVTIAELSLDYDEDGSERVYFRDEASSAKLGPIRSIIEGPWAGQPVLIYTDSKIGAHFIAGRMQRAGVDARTWTGDLSRPEREKLKQAFLAGEFDYLVVTVQSFGTGIDGFQRRCNKVIWVSEADGNPALNRQAIARIFRPGMTEENGGFAHVKLVIEDSVDEISMQQLINKAWAIRAAMNGGIAA